MGCTESIISEIVARSNTNAQKGAKGQTKVQPAPLRSDKGDRDEARERRRKAVLARHAKNQAMAQTISDNAMAEKERLSNSTWRSWRSGVNSDIVSPAVSISIRGSDGTASPDLLPNPASAYIVPEEDVIPSPSFTQQDINANDMQIRTLELPNQVMEEPTKPANQNGELLNERLNDGGGEETMQKEKTNSFNEGCKTVDEQKCLEEPLLNGHGPQGDDGTDTRDNVTPLEDDEKEKRIELEVTAKKRGGKKKAVKFTDQDESMKENGKEKSKGR